jgi:hypothetical protein
VALRWRQRFSKEFLDTFYEGGGGWKQAIIGEGDRLGKTAYTCTELEIVVQNTYQRGAAQMYQSCGGKDGRYEPLEEQGRWGQYKADQWMTFTERSGCSPTTPGRARRRATPSATPGMTI